MELTGRLSAWYIHDYHDEKYIIYGFCHDDIHGRFKEGERIQTSFILKKDFPIENLKDGDIIKTKNSTYKLEDRFPQSGVSDES